MVTPVEPVLPRAAATLHLFGASLLSVLSKKTAPSIHQ